MPVILNEDDWDLWMDEELEESEPLHPLFVPFESSEMKIEAVSTFVNNARNEGPECVEIQRELF
jgi:putative SOS response-associated peptidase YedK